MAWVVTCLKLMEWRCSQDVRPARTPLPGSQAGPTSQCLLQCLLHRKSLDKSWNFIITMDIISSSLWILLDIIGYYWIFIPFHTYPHHYNTKSDSALRWSHGMRVLRPEVQSCKLWATSAHLSEGESRFRCHGATVGWPMVTWLPSGKHTKNYGKIHHV